MNIRSLTRGDGAVIGAALLLLIASFFPFFDFDGNCPVDSCSVSAWSRVTLPMLPTVHLLGLVAAALFVAARLLPGGRKLLGLALDQWGMVLCLVVGWAGLWSLVAVLIPTLDAPGAAADPNENWTLAAGAYLTLVLALALAAAGALSTTLAALKAPLLPAPKPAPYGAPQQGAYGYPGGPQPGQQGPYGGQPQGGYGYPGGPQQGHPGQPGPAQAGAPGQPGAQQAQPGGPAAGGGAPDPNFQPFWFAVPVTRPLFGEDGAPQPVAELAPGTWYLAVEQRGQALIAQTQDGRRGVLQDTSGIQRG
ncbi:hypothetical protein DB35_16970 [Streptomyces abyssalis]|uniref:Uncharacterized protein n=1 Tax=Streptomyces abyssalis TaxID=933944 RepID=A0A1E7JKD2_9ACTN|nr:hypothetical protein [Streptomyces abyssalis]OEU88110.1 hypothetical protein AN215_18145 [Streptomyces abyssalis]OEU90981.1 hypothetical protein DB35_16970 [Streptomyces abyssalis]OEV31003.1 hypothetical protein AN219_07540 [Streptomyces nanshensis]